jgi:hypothetical protein
VTLDMQLEAQIELTQRCTFRLGSTEFGHELGRPARANSGRCDRASLEMHLDATID